MLGKKNQVGMQGNIPGNCNYPGSKEFPENSRRHAGIPLLEKLRNVFKNHIMRYNFESLFLFHLPGLDVLFDCIIRFTTLNA